VQDNPSDKDINQGTLVVFNLEASVSNDDLRHIFGQYGEVKEVKMVFFSLYNTLWRTSDIITDCYGNNAFSSQVRETPHKRHHKFIEFYDVRAAEAALRALNRSDIAGKRIKLEPSRPGGARRR
jgi:RNA recognition motif-containing protein